MNIYTTNISKNMSNRTHNITNWTKIKIYLNKYKKIMYTILIIYDYIYNFKEHIKHYTEFLNVNKQEYLCILENIVYMTDKINIIRQKLYKQHFLYLADKANLFELLDLYTNIIYLTEKYGSNTIIITINYHLLLYTEIIDIYNYLGLNDTDINQYTNAVTNKKMLYPSKRSVVYNRKRSLDKNIDKYNYTSVEPNISLSKLNKIINPISNAYHNLMVNQNKLITKSLFTTLNSTLLRNIYTIQKTINCQYLNLLNNIITPFETNVFLKHENNYYDLYCFLGHEKMASSDTTIHSTNNIFANVYKSILMSSQFTNGVNFMDITDNTIISGIKHYDNISSHILHVFINIPISTSSTITFIVNGFIANPDISVCNKYYIIRQKYELLKQHIIGIEDLNITFKLNCIKIISIKQLLCIQTVDIIKYIYSKWSIYCDIMNMNVTDLLSYFNGATKYIKLDILYSLLLNNYNPDAIFKVQLLWSMLIDETTSNKLQNELFDLIRIPEFQLLLSSHNWNMNTNMNTNTNTNTSKKNTDDTAVIDTIAIYESRIVQCGADETTKAKMNDKLKEIKNKNNDNISKPQQYLDGLLDIPFGMYKKESVIIENDKLQESIRLLLSNLIIVCIDYKQNFKVCGDLILDIFGLFSLPIPTLLSTTEIDNEVKLEETLLTIFRGTKIKQSQLDKLLCLLETSINSRISTNANDIDNDYLVLFLQAFDPTVITTLCTLLSERLALSIKSIHDIYTIILPNNSHLTELLFILNNEGYFYDTGFPYILVNYKSKLLNIIDNYVKLMHNKRSFLNTAYNKLDNSIYGQKDAKEQIIRIIAQWLNGNQSGYCLGFEGAPGIGKTSLAKYGVSQALQDDDNNARPFGFIALGGSSNGSLLEGHSYTYVGSTWGRIVEILMTAKCMNPIIFIDELDKISMTENGRELIGILTHITDKTQNMDFMDKYFSGVKIDLSQVLFIFSYNDYDKLDSILADRIHRVQFDNYTTNDKLNICNNYLIPRIINEINLVDMECIFTIPSLKYIIETYTFEAGVRKLKEKLYDIIRELNVKCIRGDNSICDTNDTNIIINTQMIDEILHNHYKIDIPKPYDEPKVGIVYGLYATSAGIGGLSIIQITKKNIDMNNSLLCTGKAGDVMLESMKVALTLASNIVPASIMAKWGGSSDKIIADSCNTNKFSIHIHCPDGSTPKDGPSAGCAFTLGLISLLTNIPVSNTVSMTGEIDIIGRVMQIGGLDSKIQGSSKSGIRKILVPFDNKCDIDKLIRKQPEIFEDVEIIFTKTIEDVIKYGLIHPIPTDN